MPDLPIFGKSGSGMKKTNHSGAATRLRSRTTVGPVSGTETMGAGLSFLDPDAQLSISTES
jgi:hypothetical protein